MIISKVFWVICISRVISVYAHKKNVCKTYRDYFFRDISPNCWYDPDVTSSIPGIIHRHGYPFESHEAITEDGYILNVFRIPNHNSTKERIVLVHPVAASSADFVTEGNKSLAFLLADNGYDVWLPNLRGTYLSEKHVNLSSKTNAYWNFSFHEIGIYDIPAIIDLVLRKTNTEKVSCYGHSMGGTALTVYASLFPERSSKTISSIIVFGPVVYLKHITSPLALLAPFGPLILKFFEVTHDMNPFSYRGLYHKIITFLCYILPGTQFPCEFLVMLTSGLSFSQLNAPLEPLQVTQNVAGFSIKIFAHYAQEVVSGGRFQFWDRGPLGNKKVYNSLIPPRYPVEDIRVPYYIYYGNRDIIADKKDVLQFAKDIPSEFLAQKPKGLPFNHIDVFYGKGAPGFYEEMIQLLNEINN